MCLEGGFGSVHDILFPFHRIVNFGGKAEWKYGWSGAWDGDPANKPGKSIFFRVCLHKLSSSWKVILCSLH
jgi:hypothetical protein